MYNNINFLLTFLLDRLNLLLNNIKYNRTQILNKIHLVIYPN